MRLESPRRSTVTASLGAYSTEPGGGSTGSGRCLLLAGCSGTGKAASERGGGAELEAIGQPDFGRSLTAEARPSAKFGNSTEVGG
jgi:hypothetical protein